MNSRPGVVQRDVARMAGPGGTAIPAPPFLAAVEARPAVSRIHLPRSFGQHVGRICSEMRQRLHSVMRSSLQSAAARD